MSLHPVADGMLRASRRPGTASWTCCTVPGSRAYLSRGQTVSVTLSEEGGVCMCRQQRPGTAVECERAETYIVLKTLYGGGSPSHAIFWCLPKSKDDVATSDVFLA